MKPGFSRRHPILLSYLFFLYFSVVIQFLIYMSGTSSTVGIRQALVMSVIWLIPILIFPSKIKFIAAAIGLMLWVSALISLGYWLIFDHDLSQSAIFIIFESNMAEGSEFVGSYFRWSIIAYFVLFSVIPFFIWKKIQPFDITKSNRLKLGGLLGILFFGPLLSTTIVQGKDFSKGYYHQLTRMEPAMPWNIVVGYSRYLEQLSAMNTLLLNNQQIPPLENFSEKNPDAAKTMVLVIGESTNRERMSLYGYQRQTTPRLDKIRDQLFVFNDVISPRPYTIETLQQMLSFAHQKDIDSFFAKPNLINMMKQAGYEITWITNQQTQSKRNTMLTTLSQLADQQIYLNNNRAQNASQYDGAVLAPFAKAVSSSARKKLIIVHLLGTHRKYHYRYPEDYAKFKTRENVPDWITESIYEEYNNYDNAIYYNDFVVSELIRRLDNNGGEELFVYLSDHGEEVYDYPDKLFSGRNEDKPTPAMYTVPFIVWANTEYLASNSTASWKSYANRPFTTSDFIYTWSEMVGINYKIMEFSRSVISKAFIKRPRLIGNPNKPKSLQDYTNVLQGRSS